MTKLPYNIKAVIFLLVYISCTIVSYFIGTMIQDVAFGFGMIQVTITTLLLIVYYPSIALENKKLTKTVLSNFAFFLICCALFTIVALSSYLHVWGNVPRIVISADTHIVMLVFLMISTLFCFTINETFLIGILSSLTYKANTELKLIIASILYILLKIVLAFIMSPSTIVIHSIFVLITACCVMLLKFNKKSVFLYPIAATVIGLLFVLIS